MISPTGKGIRGLDKWGSGEYGASRGNRLHRGVDYICEPGKWVRSPITGIFVREARPYPHPWKYSGVLIKGENVEIKMFYLQPNLELIGEKFFENEIIGVAQDISERYPGMTPHIHFEIV